MEQKKEHHETEGYKTYLFTWSALLALLFLTIEVTNYHLGTAGVLISLLIASVKAALILYFFMHMRYESRFFKLAFLLPIAVLLLSIGFTFLDVLYR